MKTKITILVIIFFTFFNSTISFAQNIGINGSGATADPSALLDINASATPSLGILIPRIALQAINLAAPVTSPATSLLVYNTASASTGTNAVSAGYYYWDGAKWVRFAYNASGSSSTAWDLSGNVGTNSSINFLGTTDAQDLVFKTNNTEKMRILGGGNVGINKSIPTAKLHIYNTFAGAQSDTSVFSEYLPQSSLGITHFMASGLSTLAAATNVGYGLDFTSVSFANEYGLYFKGETKNYFSGNVGIGTTVPASPLDVNGMIISGTGTSTNGSILLAGQYGGSTQMLTLFGTEQSSGGPVISYGVKTGTTVANFINTHSLSSINRAALSIGGLGGGSAAVFRFFGESASNIAALGITVVMPELMRLTNQGNLGINTTTPSEKLEVQGSVKIVDGTQGVGRVLTSDVNGKASWGTLGPQTSVGTIPNANIVQTQTAAYQYMGYSIVVPVGRSTVSAGIFTQTSDNSMNYYTCQLSGSSTIVGNTTGFSNLPGLCAVVGNHQGTAVGTVVYYVNNTSGSPKTLYLWGYPASFIVGGTITLRGSSTAAEPYIIAAY